MIVLFVKYFLEQIKGNEMGVACSTNGGGKSKQKFGWEPLESYCVEDVGVGGKMTLNMFK